jgi:hypothetical protein
MQTKMVIFPSEEGFNVLVWGKWTEGSMCIRSFDNRETMISLLENLRLLTHEEAQKLEQCGFTDSCPLYSTEADEGTLVAHGFRRATP